MKTLPRFVIIDGNAIIHRAYHAIPPLTTKDGVMVNAVYGFTSMLLKVISDLKPDHLAVSFDVAGGTFRDKVFEKYKANRVKADQELYDQIPLVHEVVKAFGIPIYVQQGYEADDVIGTLVKKTQEEVEIIIVSGDRDLLQLVDDNTSVYLLKKGLSEMEMYNEKKVEEHFGFGPKLVVDYKALRGDASDNIPGVKGIGEKTAKDLIAKIGGIDEIYQALKKDEEAVKKLVKESVVKKLKEDEAGAKMSKELATLHCDVPNLDYKFNATDWQKPNAQQVKEIMHRFEFFSLAKRAETVLNGGKEIAPAEKKKKKTESQKIQKIKVSSKNLNEFLKLIEKEKIFSALPILKGEDMFQSNLEGCLFATRDKIFEVLFLDLKAGELKSVLDIFKEKEFTFIGHDIKETVKIIELHDGKVENTLFDVMIASYVLNSSTRAHDFASIVFRELGEEVAPTQANLFGMALPGEENLEYIFAVYDIYSKQLLDRADLGLFEKVEMELIPVLSHMERAGVAVDRELLQELSKDVKQKLEKITKKIWEHAGEEFNVASSVQLREVLFEKMQLGSQGIKKGKTGFSTAASELEKLRGLHPIIECIEEHRELSKLQNTYVDVLPTLIHPKTHRIHTHFNQAVAATGRLSSSDPNLQNIPIRTEMGKKIRDAFIAEKGNVLISADYSQIELRIVASLARDEKLIEIFENGLDVHRSTAAAIQNIPLEEVTKEMRSAAKEVNFGVLYGMGAYGLSWRAGIPQWEAKQFIEKYFEEFSGVKKYLDETLKFAKQNGYVETLFGRRRYIPEIESGNYQLRSAAERMAINMPIQGTAADLMKMAMIEVYKKIKAKKYSEEEVRMILQVHDELVLEVKKGLEDEISELVQKTMQEVAELRVPIETHVSIGHRWGEMK